MPALLELLVRSSAHQQIILLTEDQSIASWARLESMTGTMALVEPSRDVESAPATTGADTAERIIAL